MIVPVSIYIYTVFVFAKAKFAFFNSLTTEGVCVNYKMNVVVRTDFSNLLSLM